MARLLKHVVEPPRVCSYLPGETARLEYRILLDVKAGGASLVARVEPNVRVKVHEGIRLALNADRVHFFDNKTELAL